ncbi:MAG: hypothetical protein AB7T31_06960 [Gemmatimonadales bacterium]
MEQLIFFGVIIFLSIVESIARSRKQPKGGPLPEMPPEWEAERAEQARRQRTPRRPLPRTDLPTYDQDTSFDARATAEVERSYDEVASSEEERRKRMASSESMIPQDLWEEIAGLAQAKVDRPAPGQRPAAPKRPQPPVQQRTQPRTVPKPQRPVQRGGATQPTSPLAKPRAQTPPRPVLPRAAEPAVEGAAAHAVHLSHAGYGTDPSGRAPSAQDGLDPIVRALDPDAAAVREQLRAGGVHALRQALILQEVLGPPASTRPDPFD